MTWAVTVLYTDTNIVCVKIISANDRKNAYSTYRACYRHSNYEILSVVEVPTGTKTGINGD